jgi:hypothetical protein
MIGMDGCHMFYVFVHCLHKIMWMSAWGGRLHLSVFKLFTQECWIDLIETQYCTNTRKDVWSSCFWFILVEYNLYLMWSSNFSF